MKKFSKMFALMLLAGALVVGFASCSNDSSDSSNSSSGVGVALSSLGTLDATYQKDVEGKWRKIFLFSDGKAYKASQEALTGGAKDGIIKRGKFEKTNTYKDGTITITWEDELQKNGNWTAVADEREKSEILTLTNGKSGGWTLTGNDSSSNNNNSSTAVTVSAIYKHTGSHGEMKYTLYSDASWVLTQDGVPSAMADGTAKGTYEKTGEKFSDCTIQFTKTQGRSGTEPYGWIDEPATFSTTVSSGSCSIDKKSFTLQN